MTRTQLREMPRQDLIEFARRGAERLALLYTTQAYSLLLEELADRLSDLPRVDDYPFNSYNPEGTPHV